MALTVLRVVSTVLYAVVTVLCVTVTVLFVFVTVLFGAQIATMRRQTLHLEAKVQRASASAVLFLFFFTLVTGPRRSLSFKLRNTRVYESASVTATPRFAVFAPDQGLRCPSVSRL